MRSSTSTTEAIKEETMSTTAIEKAARRGNVQDGAR
jgi:hypothetical protein